MARKQKEMCVIVMHKGNRDVEANMLKTMAMTVLMRFVARVRKDVRVLEDNNTLMLVMPEDPGDKDWVHSKVLRYVDILGATTDEQVERKVGRLVERFEAQEDASPDKVGMGIVLWQMGQYYLLEKSASVFTVEGLS